MKTAIILALTSATIAVPFGNVVDAMFGTNIEARHEVHADHMPSFQPIGKGSGTGVPFPTRNGPCPTASGGKHHHSQSRHAHNSKTLAIDYTLAPTADPTPGGVVKRQGGTQPLPSFTLLDSSDVVPGVPKPTRTPGSLAPSPTAQPEDPVPTDDPESPFPTATDDFPFPEPTTEPEDPESPFPTNSSKPPFPMPSGRPSAPFPTDGVPQPTSGFPLPTGGFSTPTGGFPGRPTTLLTHTRRPHPTHTRGPKPTPSTQPVFPQFPGDDNDEDEEPSNSDGPNWLDWLKEMFGHRGNGRSEMENQEGE